MYLRKKSVGICDVFYDREAIDNIETARRKDVVQVQGIGAHHLEIVF